MKKCLVIGASGYSGAQLTALISNHPNLELSALAVSKNSDSIGRRFSDDYPQYCQAFIAEQGLIYRSFEEIVNSEDWSSIDIVFLATPHEFSAGVVPSLLADNKQIFDLSGAYRLTSSDCFAEYYGFAHPHADYLSDAIYGLPEINRNKLRDASLVAVAGCYPSASILGLHPVVKNQWHKGIPVINAISGVSGAGRGAKAGTSFCEVSLQAYGVGTHRHTPEIEQATGHPVIFTPHLGNFNRGILATITVPIVEQISGEDIVGAFDDWVNKNPLLKQLNVLPAIHQVIHTPFCYLAIKYLKHKNMLQIFSAIDNLLKGAASSAIQCCNLANNWSETTGLLSQKAHEAKL
ncbi:N-acetyl-gamma-glutamyl-phosphate reductase [Pleionea sediminis]|uniref:N-acetyl-gamma-glutamyl-phosphate reductase n=1 Tax=Pleionea sediminis TaxID=2569479 RepID=UPI001185038D|nr:N-acetyl-gamma-glutamyl-phosphate reductase [Pleionea sediminis]